MTQWQDIIHILYSENVTVRNLWLKHSAVNGMCKIQPILFFHSYSVSGVKNVIPNQLPALKSLT